MNESADKALELAGDVVIENVAPKLTFNRLFWIFLLGSFLGVLIEGVFAFFGKGHWETHVVCMWGWINPLYGTASVGFYIGSVMMHKKSFAFKAIVMTVIATVLELLAGLLLKYAIGMRAWNYDDLFLNYDGMICPLFSLLWGLIAVVFILLTDKINHGMRFFDNKSLKITGIILTVLLVVNFSLTTMAISRWSSRRYGIQSDTQIGAFLDRIADDKWMSNRFVEWEFLDDVGKL
jgi:uncharacterized membrane protein